MARKKTTVHSKTWRLAGEALSPTAISETEEKLMEDIFSDFQTLMRAESALGIRTGNMRGQETVVKACLGYFCERFGGEYERESVIKALATAAAIPVGPVEITTDSVSVTLGAALWLLDYAESHNLQSELLALLPEDGLSEVCFPIPYEDFRYPPGVVRRTLTAFLRRKKGAAKEFRKLMGLLRKDAAAKLRGAFRETLLDYFNRFLEVCKRVTPPPFPGTSHPLAPPPSALELFSTARRTPPPSLREFSERTPDMAFLMKTPALMGLSPEEMQTELYYRRMTELLSEFTVSDPYAICAASLLLEREGDLLMSLNTLTNAVLACAERRLPWALPYAGETPELYERQPPENPLRYPFQKPAGEETPDEDRDDGDDEDDEDGEDIPEGALLSAAQLFHMATGYLLPRDRRPSAALEAWFRAQGLSAEESAGLSMAAMALSVCADARTDADSGLWEGVGDAANAEKSGKTATAAKSAKDAPTPVETREEPEPGEAERVAELNRQVKAVRQALHEKELEARQLEDQLRDEQRHAEQDRMELHGLRETLFRTRAGETTEFDAPENPVRFPYQVRRRVLIFGGHDTWSKSIRPLLPGARFFQRESLPDLNAIKGADVVWIQANALSHKFYYRIIETARRENIEVRYFGFASARKCAEQVAEREIETEET